MSFHTVLWFGKEWNLLLLIMTSTQDVTLQSVFALDHTGRYKNGEPLIWKSDVVLTLPPPILTVLLLWSYPSAISLYFLVDSSISSPSFLSPSKRVEEIPERNFVMCLRSQCPTHHKNLGVK